jgi:hypothetical protein
MGPRAVVAGERDEALYVSLEFPIGRLLPAQAGLGFLPVRVRPNLAATFYAHLDVDLVPEGALLLRYKLAIFLRVHHACTPSVVARRRFSSTPNHSACEASAMSGFCSVHR